MFEIFGLKIYLYGLLIGVGVWAAIEISLVRKKTQAEKKLLEKAFPWVVFGGIVGARLYHVIDFWSRYYTYNPLKIFYVWEGGLGIWGAIVGGVIGLLLFSKVKKINFLELFNSLVIGVPFAQAIGRLGNWVNGELYGKNGELLFVYEAGLNILLGFLLIYISRPGFRVGARNDRAGGIYLIGYGVIRIVLENLRPEEIIWRVGGIPMAIIFGVLAIVGGMCIIYRRRS